MTAPYNSTNLDETCMDSLSSFFNTAALAFAKFTHIDVYTPDWDNIDNDGFIKNAEFYGVKSLIADVTDTDQYGNRAGALIHTLRDGAFKFAALQYRMADQDYDHSLRLKEVYAFAQNWMAQQSTAYAAPRLIEIPSLKMTALWLAGEKDVFIPVAEFKTKLGDAIAVDDTFIDKVRTASAEQQRAYDEARKQAIKDGEDPNLLGGGASPRLRPPGG